MSKKAWIVWFYPQELEEHSCPVLVGVFTSRESADEAMAEEIAATKFDDNPASRYDVEEVTLDEKR